MGKSFLRCLILVLFSLSQQDAARAATAKMNFQTPSTTYSADVSQATEMFLHGDQSRADLKRDNCQYGIPCGYHNLCCDDNELCYTAPNLEASCKATAAPSNPSIIIFSVSFQAYTSVETTIRTSTETATRTNFRTQTSVHTNTTVQTSKITLVHTLVTTYTPAKTTTHIVVTTPSAPNDNGTFNSTLAATRDGDSWQPWEKNILGATSGAAALFLLVLICMWSWRKWRNRQAKESFASMQRDGTGTFRMMDTAKIPESQSSRPARSDDAAPSLLPRDQPHLPGRNPYEPPGEDGHRPLGEDEDEPPWSPDDIPAPPYDSRSGTLRQAHGQPSTPPGAARFQRQPNAGPMRSDARRHGAVPVWQSSSRIPRRPVGNMGPTVEDSYEE